MGHCKKTDSPVNRQTENERKSPRFDKIKRHFAFAPTHQQND